MSCDTQEYDQKERFISYWHQINELQKLAARNILEVGIGNGFVSEYLRRDNRSVVTFDIDRTLHPDVAGTVLHLPFRDSAFEAVLCCETLEHLPHASFIPCLKELSRVSQRDLVISLPDREFAIPLRVFRKKKLLVFPRLIRRNFKIHREHQWEIGQRGLALKDLVRDIRAAGLMVRETYRVFECDYHRFFVLTK